ncbi:hypothetical protein [Catenulispora subtropica]|uniref:Uncharacterized protein n=1 Tax=Catenulispora subtropica TaxID=450798 RepID=A0ABN2T814_9ACTN
MAKRVDRTEFVSESQSGVGTDGSMLSYAPVTSTSVLSVVAGECQ